MAVRAPIATASTIPAPQGSSPGGAAPKRGYRGTDLAPPTQPTPETPIDANALPHAANDAPGRPDTGDGRRTRRRRRRRGRHRKHPSGEHPPLAIATNGSPAPQPAQSSGPAAPSGAAAPSGVAHDPLRPKPASPRPPSGVLGMPEGEDLVVFHRRAAGGSRFVLRESFD